MLSCLATGAALSLTAVPAAATNHQVPGQHRHVAFHPDQDYLGSTMPASLRQQSQVMMPMVSGPKGIDVSHWQGTINWGSVHNAGIRFAYMKATEGTGYEDPSFDRNYIRSYNNGLIRGAYHFARPNLSSGATQANFFVNHGGGWSGDGKTMPPLLDMEWNPYGGACYGKSKSGMRSWIESFVKRMKYRTGKYPVIYTSTSWWNECVGSWSWASHYDPLMVARYASSPGTLPAGYSVWTIWQYTSTGSVSGVSGNVDRDVFNGSYTGLRRLATCTAAHPHCL